MCKNTPKKKNKKQLLIVALLSIMILGLTACLANGGKNTSGEQGAQENKPKIVLGDAQWESLAFHNAVAQVIIEEGYGYEIEIIPGSTAAIFTGLESGDVDILMETWVQNIKEMYDGAIEAGDIIETSVNFDDNRQGFFVPTYVIEGDEEKGIEPMAPDLRTVKDLKRYPEVFPDDEEPSKGRVYGAPPGWEVDNILQMKFETYEIDETFNLFNPGSSSGLAASLGTSYENGDPWVGYYWEPEWVMAKYDLTLLEDEPFNEDLWGEENGYACEWPSVDVTIVVHNEFPEKAPDVYEFLQSYQTSKEINNIVLEYMQDNDMSSDETAIWFLNEYEDLWTSWLPEENAQNVKDAIAK